MGSIRPLLSHRAISGVIAFFKAQHPKFWLGFGISFACVALSFCMPCAGKPTTPEAEKPLTVAILEDSPPYDFYNAQNELVGMNLDIMREVGRRAKRPIHFQVTTYNRVVVSLLNKQVDVIAAPQSVSNYRSQVVTFTRPYLFSSDILVSHATQNASSTLPLNDLRDLAQSKLTVGVFNGTSYPQFLTEKHLGKQMAIYPTQREMFLAFLNQKIPVMLMDEHIARHYAQSQTVPFHLSEGKVRTHKAMAFAVNKDNVTLANMLNIHLAAMEADGTLARIQQKWL